MSALRLSPHHNQSVHSYDPTRIAMRAVHQSFEEGDYVDLTAMQFDELRQGKDPADVFKDTNIDPLKITMPFSHKGWSFGCPCCGGDALSASHVKKSKDGKATHWRIDKGFHDNEDCSQYSPAVMRLRQRGIKYKHRGVDNKIIVKLKSDNEDVDSSFDRAGKLKGTKEKAYTNYVNIGDLWDMYEGLNEDERRDVEVRIGKDKRSLSSLILTEPEALLNAVKSKRRQDYIFAISPDWDKAQPSGLDDECDVPGYRVCAYDAKDNAYVDIALEMRTDSMIASLFQAGRLDQRRQMLALVRPEFKFGEGQSVIVLRCNIDGLSDFVQTNAIRYEAAIEPGVGGTQAVMDLAVSS
ncbi:MAG: hypothetical protein AB8B83_02970 [Bdellovibrionales bacterium]